MIIKASKTSISLMGVTLVVLIITLVIFGGDYSLEITDGYKLLDNGDPERLIVHVNDDGLSKIMVDSYVAKYNLEGGYIYVYRIPRETYKDGTIVHSQLLNSCEKWRIEVGHAEAKLMDVLPRSACRT